MSLAMDFHVLLGIVRGISPYEFDYVFPVDTAAVGVFGFGAIFQVETRAPIVTRPSAQKIVRLCRDSQVRADADPCMAAG